MLFLRHWLPSRYKLNEVPGLILFLGIDLLILVAALNAAIKLRGVFPLGSLNAAVVYELPFVVYLWLVFAWCVASLATGLYRRKRQAVQSLILRWSRAYILFIPIFGLGVYFSFRSFSRLQFIYFVILAVVFLALPRLIQLWRAFAPEKKRNHGFLRERTYPVMYGLLALSSIAMLIALPRAISIFLVGHPGFEGDQIFLGQNSSGIPRASLRPDISLVAEGLQFPVSMAFTPDRRLFFTEKSGAVRVISEGELLPNSVLELETNADGHYGLMGIAVDPLFESNHHIWITFARNVGSGSLPGRELTESGILRFTERNGTAEVIEEAFVIKAETSGTHFINNLRFGPDGMLYVSIGDFGNADNAQFAFNPWGKIHRLEPTVPLEFSTSGFINETSLFAFGLRNVFDFDFSAQQEIIYALDNGDNCEDELNLVKYGGNYGWRNNFQCGQESDSDVPGFQFQDPIQTFDPAIAPTGVMYYKEGMISILEDKLVFCSWNDGRMYIADIDLELESVESLSWLDLDRAACQTDVVQGPDGRVYFSSANAIYVINDISNE